MLSPFLAAILSIFDIRSRVSRVLIFVFCILFGLTFIPEYIGADSFRYANTFHSFAKDPEGSWLTVYDIYVNHEGYYKYTIVKDLWVYAMYYIAAKIGGDNVHVFFALVAVVFAFFCLKCLKYITSNKYFTGNIYMVILCFLFLYTNNIQNINGVRFWTTSWIAVYITFKAIIDKKIGYALLLLPLPLMHSTFTLYWLFFAGAYLLKRKLNVLFVLFWISFAFSEVGFALVNSVSSSLPGFMQEMIYAYTESNWAMARMDGSAYASTAGYAKFFNALPRLFELMMVALVLFRRKYLKNKSVAGFMIAYFCMVNFLAAIPSMGRYYIVGWPLLIYVWVSEWPAMKRYRNLLMLAPIAYCYNIFLWIRFIIVTTHWSLYLSNPLHIIYRNLFYTRGF